MISFEIPYTEIYLSKTASVAWRNNINEVVIL